MPGLTLVISPLISLMKDQVAALNGMGIPAAFLNSSLDTEEFRQGLPGNPSGNAKTHLRGPRAAGE